MASPRFHALRIPLTLAVALLSAAVFPLDALAADQAARLTLSVELQRQARTALGAEHGQMKLTQRAEYAITLVSDGARLSSNPLDPAEAGRQLAQAQRAQAKVQAALAANAARPTARSAAPMDMQAMQAMAQRIQAQCGIDRDCLMREASQFSAAQVAAQAKPGGDPALAGRLQAYGAAYRDCERQHPAGPQREACANRARVQAGGVADEAEETIETPYLLFRALPSCQPAGSLSLDERIEGSFADVQGQVAFSETRQADNRRASAAFPCGTQMAVLDTRNGRLWVGSPVLGLQVQGVSVRSERGRAPQRQEGLQELRWHEAAPWLTERLSKLDRQGSAETTLPAGVDGKTQVRLQWRWQPL
jgi:hypothetical protein